MLLIIQKVYCNGQAWASFAHQKTIVTDNICAINYSTGKFEEDLPPQRGLEGMSAILDLVEISIFVIYIPSPIIIPIFRPKGPVLTIHA